LMEQELKHCPFCGSTNTWYHAKYVNRERDDWAVFCRGCGARSGYDEWLAPAIAKWNARVADKEEENGREEISS
jgi:Lar family restriction alleviation protein